MVVVLSLIVSVLALITGFVVFKLKKTKEQLCRIGLLYNNLDERFKHLSAKSDELQKLLADAEQLALVTRQTENAVMIMNAQGDIIWVNDSFTRMYGYSYEQFVASLGHNIRQTSFNPKILERLERCISTQKPVVYEALNITKGGKEIWTRTSLLPLINESREVIGLVTVDSDIHQRVVATEELICHIQSFNEKIERIAEQLNVMVDLTDALFERINISHRRIDRTDQIIGTVKEISDQTKILGINASIEAHAAGENGKSFRVIANEIVNVSNTTNKALSEISQLITKIQSSSDKLTNEKERSESAITSHRSLISELKKEINEVQSVIQGIK